MKSVLRNIKRRLSVEPKLSEIHTSGGHYHTLSYTETNSGLNAGNTQSIPDRPITSNNSLKDIQELNESLGLTHITSGGLTTSECVRKEDPEQSTTPKTKNTQTDLVGSEEAIQGKDRDPNLAMEKQHKPKKITDNINSDQITPLDYGIIGHSKIEGATQVEEDFTTLKPIVREKVYHHVIEEVQKVKVQERHVVHIRHHVQPILNPQGFRHESNVYRIGSLSADDPNQVVTLTQEEIDTLTQQHLSRYHDSAYAEHISPPSETVNVPEIEKNTTVVHNYNLIQPVIVQPDPNFRFSFGTQGKPLSEEIVIGSDAALKTEQSEVYKLTSKINKLKAQNDELKSLLNLANQRATLVHHGEFKDPVKVKTI
ncbi:hypothetical protein CROQUDRAFT_664568 [Cronartium quercuum f. sp. fusiforme G11]|uniref:Uncharacterized protein n=1 Tax=Cronartium quercuum f. sp. fusiforme G11 TaxID=708437 RepID=A0A9P6NAU0_9BASI|nr:hypothetical protein CROQUDRAFT_664568 [Cronartium quercuum f. sp. fusiforme G11]